MDSIIFNCRTITPMFLNGADGNTPEFRTPSLKGVLRFWWRAAQAETDMKILKERENAIFGGVGENEGKSTFCLRVMANNFYAKPFNLLPHHTGKSHCPICLRDKLDKCRKGNIRRTAIANNQDFKVTILFRRDTHKEEIRALFQLVALLGGLGRRSRRGFGSFKILTMDDQIVTYENPLRAMLGLLNIVAKDKYKEYNNAIGIKKPPAAAYPFIRKIEIGKAYPDTDSLLRVIGRSSHDNNSKYTGFVQKDKRLASPVYVSIMELGHAFYPVVTTLNSDGVFPTGREREIDLSDGFKEAILN